MEMRCTIYARVSSVDERRQSTERQIVDLKNYATKNDYSVEGVFEEHIRGAKKNSERIVLNECFDYMLKFNIPMLLVSELSRLGRNVDEVLASIRFLKENKINVFFQKEGFSIFDKNGKENPFSTIMIACLGTASALERENIKFRLNSGRRNYIAKGGVVGRPKGTKKSLDKKKEEYKEVIKLLKQSYPIRKIEAITSAGEKPVSLSTIKRIKKEFCL